MTDNISHLPVNPAGGPLKGVRGAMLTFRDDPAMAPASLCHDYYADGLAVIQDGRILAAGEYADVTPAYPGLTDIDRYEAALILPGFIDCHAHYVQAPMIGSYGDTLIDWLNRYTFPTEARFRDKDFADEVARMFFRQTLSAGTTTANVFSTTFEASVNALFEESERYNARTITGKVLQDRNLPENLKDPSAEGSMLLTEKLMAKWHRRGRQLYAIIPRFAPTSTPLQLKLAGELYRAHLDQGVYLHTHLDEAEGEIRWAMSLFPEARDYTDIYDRFGLLGHHTVLAHCCIVTPREWKRLSEAGCGVAHCPSSNLFLGDGEFKYRQATDPARPCRVGIGSDVGAGTSFSIPRQLGDAYKVAMLDDNPLDALRSFYMATLGGARVLRLEDTIGSIRPGREADLAVLDLKATEFLEWRLQFAHSLPEKLFVLQTLAPDNLNRATYVAGKKVFDRHRPHQLSYPSELPCGFAFSSKN